MSNPIKLLLIAVVLAGGWAALSMLEPEAEDRSCGSDHAGGG